MLNDVQINLTGCVFELTSFFDFLASASGKSIFIWFIYTWSVYFPDSYVQLAAYDRYKREILVLVIELVRRT
jgi:hypothetical protein